MTTVKHSVGTKEAREREKEKGEREKGESKNCSTFTPDLGLLQENVAALVCNNASQPLKLQLPWQQPR